MSAPRHVEDRINIFLQRILGPNDESVRGKIIMVTRALVALIIVKYVLGAVLAIFVALLGVFTWLPMRLIRG